MRGKRSEEKEQSTSKSALALSTRKQSTGSTGYIIKTRNTLSTLKWNSTKNSGGTTIQTKYKQLKEELFLPSTNKYNIINLEA